MVKLANKATNNNLSLTSQELFLSDMSESIYLDHRLNGKQMMGYIVREFDKTSLNGKL